MRPRRPAVDDAGETTATDGITGDPALPAEDRIVDPRAVRIALGGSAAHAGVPSIVVEPAAVPLAPAPHSTGTGVLGGVAAPPGGFRPSPGDSGEMVIVDGEPSQLRLKRIGPVHAVLVDGLAEPARTAVLLLPREGPAVTDVAVGSGGRGWGVSRRDVVVDGWLVQVVIESERRASLRERARRGREETARDGPTEVHAIIPGQVVSVSVVAGDPVVAGQQLLVVEAMKMQNELRAPRDGVISRVAVGAGRTIEVGDLLLVLE
jgi:biotin carboxyl carrier protein